MEHRNDIYEGCVCPECGNGKLFYPHVENCSCHINPPCSACVNNMLLCPECGWEEERVYYEQKGNFEPVVKSFKPKPLDSTKIDWRNKSHTHFSMIKEGVYPKGTTKAEVLEKVNGTFGGRFESFGAGRFKFIAYTD